MRLSIFCTAIFSWSLVTGAEEEREFMRGEEEHCLLASPARLHAQPLQAQQNLNPELLLESVQGAAHRLIASKEAPQEIFDEIGAIQAALATMMPLLDAEHSNDQGRIQEQLEEIEACHSSAEHGTSVRDSFADELAIMTTCMDEQSAAESAQQQECDEWNNHASRLAFPSSLESSSASPEVKYELYQTLKDWVDDHGPTIESQRTECNDATTVAAAEAARCEPIVAQYGVRYCQHRLSCTLLSTCHQHELEVYQNLISDSSIGMTSRQDQYQVIVQVQCISDLITNAMSSNNTIDESSLDACDGDADVGHLSLSFPDPPALAECLHPQEGDPQCPQVDLPWAWEGGRQVTTTTTTTTTTAAFTYPWTMVLQYGGEPYLPTREAVGTLDAGVSQFAKLSDASINEVPSGDDSYTYWKFSGTRPGLPNGAREAQIFRVLGTASAYDDIAYDLGMGERYGDCGRTNPPAAEQNMESPDQCLDTAWNGMEHAIDISNGFTNSVRGARRCRVWESGRPYAGGNAYCLRDMSAPRSEWTAHAPWSMTHRCFTSAGDCQYPQEDTMWTDVHIEKFTGPAPQ